MSNVSKTLQQRFYLVEWIFVIGTTFIEVGYWLLRGWNMKNM